VEALSLAWYQDFTDHNVVEATPLVVDGVMYVTGAMGKVHAIDARTGAERWFYDPEVPPQTLVRACCQPVNRGAAVGYGKVFVGALDGRLIALDAGSGEPVWETVTTDPGKPFTITGAPRVMKNMVVIGNAGAEYGVRGYVSAYHVDSGEMLWRFYTVPGNPADGFENEAMRRAAATWTGEWWKYGAGGTVWDAIVYDPELDLVYIGTGNGAPWDHQVRSPEGGDNLYLASIVALDADSGEYVWHYQTTPAETWDFTATQPIILADMEIAGRERKVLMQAPKNGMFYVLDRTSGELISAEPFVPVTWNTGVDASGRPIENPASRPKGTRTIYVQPGPSGAHSWHPMAYSPDSGLVYIPTNEGRFLFKNDPDFEYQDGFWNLGFDLSIPMDYAAFGSVLERDSYLLAWDPVRQREAWRAGGSGGGVLATAGGLVFRGEATGQFAAYDAVSGERLWSSDVQNSGVAAPISYSVNGEQYIAIALGRGAATMQKAAIPHPALLPHANRVVAFKLQGSAELPPYEYTPEKLRATPTEQVDAELAAQGRVLFHRYCLGCHGREARGNRIQPDLRLSMFLDNGLWDDVVLGGVLESRGMVSFAKVLDEHRAEALRQYVILEAQKPGARAPGQSEAPVQ
jgi:quinohemoprotein ethanol dehydrogenase